MNFSNWPTVPGSGNVIVEKRAVTGFNHVSVGGAGELVVVQGNEESLTIEADDNLLPLIRSEVQNGRLSIGPEHVNLRPSRTIRYRLQCQNLNELQLSGSVRARADNIKTERLSVGISGSGKITLARLEARAFAMHLSGSGSTLAAGQVETQKVDIRGSGNLHAIDLQCSHADVQISGSGHASLWVTDLLRAHLSGSGDVEYRGRPNLETHVSGSGHVRHQNER
jgi:hypothetical protein